MVTPRAITNSEKMFLCDAAPGQSLNGLTVIAQQHVRDARWSRCMLAVFSMPGAYELYGVPYQEGLTENHEGHFPEMDDDDTDHQVVRVDCERVTSYRYTERNRRQDR